MILFADIQIRLLLRSPQAGIVRAVRMLSFSRNFTRIPFILLFPHISRIFCGIPDSQFWSGFGILLRHSNVLVNRFFLSVAFNLKMLEVAGSFDRPLADASVVHGEMSIVTSLSMGGSWPYLSSVAWLFLARATEEEKDGLRSLRHLYFVI